MSSLFYSIITVISSRLSKLEEKESKKPPESVTIEIDDTNSQLSVPSNGMNTLI